jgi:DTW domain-containing protein YfiP
MHTDQCVCSLIPSLRLDTRVVVLMHRREWSKTTATAHLAARALTNFEIRIHGDQAAPIQIDDLLTPERRALLLFPDDTAAVLTREWLADDPRPVTLIVPDGTWRQTRRMPKRIPRLNEVPAVTLPNHEPSRYRLRHEPVDGGLATYEAIARALGVIESAAVRQALERPFDAMVSRTLASRGLTSRGLASPEVPAPELG